ncbi:hypothetical protein L861_06050 [Litchfieldella anticariensis FP35 = DSM 16096]|uniref:Uncharacterized protein n=1 Tax=Litchfieldella anticariensis (strain DSM 16096 / CECT 5854 / CIP 108499 / LMG 22089 / FP35) TaxID=1121939 RepID=S2KYN7_LITA3|nr:hypothetical protein L861_06050 [Halomonas anticariensis FP35 = DSM 16096]
MAGTTSFQESMEMTSVLFLFIGSHYKSMSFIGFTLVGAEAAYRAWSSMRKY